MATRYTSVKELNVLKQCCNPLNDSHITGKRSEKVQILIVHQIAGQCGKFNKSSKLGKVLPPTTTEMVKQFSCV
jgi:hypothetical protein